MNILIVAATRQEVEHLFSVPDGQLAVGNSETSANYKIFITGVGMVATAFELGRHLATHQYNLAINLGICGSFDRSLNLGDVVEVTSDILAELGAEDDEGFLPIEQLGFGESVFNATAAINSINGAGDDSLRLKTVQGVTVNTVHGNEAHIVKTVNRLNPQVESMEGAAFFYACEKFNLPCLQIRAVSNYVEKRNRANWQIGLAIKNLNIFAGRLLQQLEHRP